MAGGRLDRLEALFEQGSRLAPEERPGFLASCTDDPELRAELGALLAASEPAERFFAELAGEVVESFAWLLGESGNGSPPGHLEVGDRVSQYVIEARLGSGGMGVVYRARDTRLGRQVALKFLPSHLRADTVSEERFLVEARAAAALNHPNVCALHEVGEDADGRVFLALGYYGGETLKERLERGPLPVDEVLELSRQIARALRAAHGHGIVHRDVKPGNVLVTDAGVVKLLDFGLAKLEDATLTAVGVRMGTVAYMSPEQTRGEGVGPASDLWSLGVLMYEMLTGARPFRGDRDRFLIQAIRHERPPSPSELRDDLPPGLERLVTGLLDPETEVRRESVGWLLAGRLDRAVTAERRERLSPLRLGVAALTFTVLALVGIVVAEPAGGAAGIRRVAVLPLSTGAGGDERTYLAAGLHDGLVSALGETEALAVTAARAALAFEGSERPRREIARELGVEALVEGTVSAAGDSVRLAVRLLRGETGEEVWSGRYASRRPEALALPAAAAREILGAVEVPSDSARPPRPPEVVPGVAAQRAYLEGVYHIQRQANLGDPDSVRAAFLAAIASLEEAIELEPNWAAPHSRLALAYHWSVAAEPERGSQLYRRAKAEALRAIALDDTDSQAFASLGYVLFMHERDWVGAERAIRRALALEPNGHHWIYAIYLQMAGRLDEAVVHFRADEERDPSSHKVKWQLAETLRCGGRHDEALREFEELAEWQGEDALRIRFELAMTYSLAGRHGEAGEEMEALVAQSDSAPYMVAGLAYIYGRGDRMEEARRLVRWLDETGATLPWSGDNLEWQLIIPETLIAVGERERFIEAVVWHYERNPDALIRLRCWPGYDEVADDPRIQEIVRGMGFPT